MMSTNSESTSIGSNFANQGGLELGDRESQGQAFPSIGFDTDLSATVANWNGSNSMDHPDFSDIVDWQALTFTHHNPHVEQGLPSAPLVTNKDLVPAEGSQSHVGLQRRSDPGPSDVNVQDNTQPLSTWVNDLARLNSFLCSPIIIPFADQSHSHVAGDRGDRRETLGGKDRLDFETIFEMAVELAEVVARLHTTRGLSSHMTSKNGNEQNSEQPNPDYGRRSQWNRQVFEIVQDSSNIMLLTSAYGRLLGHLKAILLCVQSEYASSDVRIGVNIGRLDLSDRPATQGFVIVNMVELLVRRLDRVLKSVVKEIEACMGTTSGPRATDEDDFDRRSSRYQSNFSTLNGDPGGLGLVLHVIGEQQNRLLKLTGDLRAQILSGVD